MIGRFLCKVGLELICLTDPEVARSIKFNRCRNYARNGEGKMLWPILLYQEGDIENLRQWTNDNEGSTVVAECYNFWIGHVDDQTVFQFGIGTDRFVVTLEEPFCKLLLETQQRNSDYRVLWYPPGSF